MIAKDTTTIVRFYVTTTDGFPATGKASSISANISIDGDTATAITATISESDSTNLPGWYEFEYTFDTVGNAFITFTCANCRIMPWEEDIVEVSGSSAPTAAEVADAVWCWTASIIPGQTSVIPGQNSIYTKVTNIPASVWTNDNRSLTTEVISVNKSLATDISASSIATAVWSDTANYLNTASKGYLQVNGGNVWTQVASHDPITGVDTTYGTVLKNRASSSDVTSAKTAIINAMPDVSGLSTFDPTNDTVTINATQAATMVTATGFTTPSDLAGLSTFDPVNDTVTINATQAATMVTADVSGLATPADIPTSDITAIKTKVDSLHNTDLSGIATSANVTAAQTAIVNAMPSVTGLATSQNVVDAKNAVIAAIPAIPTDYAKTTDIPDISGLATSTNISTAQAAIIAAIPAIPTDYAKTSDIPDISGLSTFNPAQDTVQLDATQLASLATGSEVTDAKDDIITAISDIDIDTSDLAKATDVAVVADMLKQVDAGVLHWSTTATVLTLYKEDNTILKTYTLRRDAQGNIVRIDPNA